MDSAQNLIDQGYAAHHAGDLQLAMEKYQAGAEVLRSMNEPLRLAHTIRHVADIHRALERPDLAMAEYAEALSIYRRQPTAGKLDIANTLRGYALAMETLQQFRIARMWWTEARNLYGEVDVQAGVDEAERRIKLLDEIGRA